MGEFSGHTVLVTQADTYMGPAIVERFRQEDAEIVEAKGALAAPGAVEELLAESGEIDVLVANLALDARSAPLTEIDDADWSALFDTLVHPLMRLVRGVAPRMIERERGKIVAVTSAAPLRGIPGATAYCAARGAQNAFVRAAGLELARSNVQFNAIAQNYVRNPTYYRDDHTETERFQKHLKRNVPLGRLAEGRETAELALFLASERSDFLVGQIVPFAGGWATNT